MLLIYISLNPSANIRYGVARLRERVGQRAAVLCCRRRYREMPDLQVPLLQLYSSNEELRRKQIRARISTTREIALLH